jgi:hypothetical protein
LVGEQSRGVRRRSAPPVDQVIAPRAALKLTAGRTRNTMDQFETGQRKSIRTRPKTLYGIIAAALAALIVGAGLIIIPRLMGGPDRSQSEIFAEPANSSGDNPFVEGLTMPPTPNVAPVNPTPAAAGATPDVSGGTPGLYARTQSASYDSTELASKIESNPEKAHVWSQASGAQPGNIHAYFNGLTPLLVRGPVRMTGYTYVNGQLIAKQVVLQSGTLVLVNKNGTPLVRVIGGNPLSPPVPTIGAPIFVGQTWPGFNPNAVYIISPSPQAITFFTVFDPVSGLLFTIPVGVVAPVVPAQVAAAPTAPAPRSVAPKVRHPVAPKVRHPEPAQVEPRDDSRPRHDEPTQNDPQQYEPQHDDPPQQSDEPQQADPPQQDMQPPADTDPNTGGL